MPPVRKSLLVFGLAAAALAAAASAMTDTGNAAAFAAESIEPGYAVRGQIALADLSAIAAAGYRTVINNRPDGEEPGQPTSAELAREARRLGLAYYHVPVAPAGASEADARALATALGQSPRPVLAFCRSGRRAAAIKAMADGLR